MTRVRLPGREPVGGVRVNRGARLEALVCFSHLRWDWVWQRPQHLLSRLARDLSLFVVEEPLPPHDDTPSLDVVTHGDVTVLTPRIAMSADGFNDQNNGAIGALLTRFFREGFGPADSSVAYWYYTPMALGAEPAGREPVLVIYDAMDDLASFRGAPRALREREAALLLRADLVFAGGPSLYETRRGRHPAVHCFASGVEPTHFAQAANGIAHPMDLHALPRPILGFYGVLDERLDLDLLADIADARPEWTLLLIGPIAKLADDALPRRSNIVYLGPRSYAELPAYLAAFDVGILPFALNHATRFISPTKTLEYLAGEKPVVSTPIKDVVDLYGQAVAIAGSAATFVAAVERVLAEGEEERTRRLTAARAAVARGDWDLIAARMRELMTAAITVPDHITTTEPEPALRIIRRSA
jgi:glycosyltransferase involved in cell wall biosynthesis